MGMRRDQRAELVSCIPDDIQHVFEPGDIPVVFAYLEKTFKLSPVWRKVYEDQLADSIKALPDEEVFFRFLKDKIEPALKLITKKNEVIFPMVRYLFKKRIAEYALQQKADRNYYSKR